KPLVFESGNYQKHYHDPSDDWGLCGGVLRCDPDGGNLEVISRGNRNPWDICFDDEFTWLGTDNDQNHGDKIFSPFFGAHFGWGHPWSYDWEGNDHMPSAPSSGPLFEGSGTGVVYLGHNRYPEKYRGVFLINDWLNRQIYIYRPKWDGAWLKPDRQEFEIFARAERGRSMGRSEGRRFDPVDIELGPDGAIYVCSWGREYGLKEKDGKQVNEGRIYRLWPKGTPPRNSPSQGDPWQDLSSHLPIWRTNAQEALLKQGNKVAPRLKATIADPSSSKALRTWSVWTLGRLDPFDSQVESFLAEGVLKFDQLSTRLQCIRVLAHRAQLRDAPDLPKQIQQALNDSEARIRHAAVLAIREAGVSSWTANLIELAATEKDRIVFYACWGAMMDLLPPSEQEALLADERPGVRQAVFLGLLETDSAKAQDIKRLAKDKDPTTQKLAYRRQGGRAEAIIKGPALDRATGKDAVNIAPLSVVTAIRPQSSNAYEEATLTRDAKAYTDRHYRFRKVPDEFVGDTFIRTPNNDADDGSGKGFTLTLRAPSTVFLADDVRAEALPAWARDQFEPTKWTLETTDAPMRVYQADFPAGNVTFGSNRDGVEARKSHYVVIVRPRLIEPQSSAPKTDEVLSLMDKADPDRGRTFFLHKAGATCVTCHQMEGMGRVFAPDLSEIGSRATPEFIIQSILEPNAQITEGFAMQIVTTKDGKSVGGILLEETGQAMKLAMTGGATVSIPRRDIVRRERADVSAMPPLGNTLTALQVADITAYLIDAKGGHKAEKREPLSGKSWGKENKGFHLACHHDRLEIGLSGKPIATYYFQHPETKRPFFAHVKTPGGIQVTRNFPPIKGQDPTDHGSMHPGISLGFAVLDGENFWHNDRGQVIHEGFVKGPAVEDLASFAVRNRYVRVDGSTICQEIARYTFSANGDGYLIALDSEFSSAKPFFFGVKEEMGLALRVATPIRVKDGGSILNGKGGKDEKGTWGIIDQWWDCFGTIQGKKVGMQIMSGPGNPEVWSHSRDYGVLVANPFPVDRKRNREKTTKIEPNQPFRLRFGVQVHDSLDFDPAASYQRYKTHR
ncbi:PmoA family protein, partial [bacterium]|nr:PmoA family protein [bacterium]